MILETQIGYDGPKMRVRGASFGRARNVMILQAGIDSIKARLKTGLDSNDTKAKPLSKSYARRKSRSTNRTPIRDLELTGQTLSELKPCYADDTTAIGDTSTQHGRLVARLNRDMMIFSDNDQANMQRMATKLFKEEIAPGAFASLKPAGGRFVARKLQSRLAA